MTTLNQKVYQVDFVSALNGLKDRINKLEVQMQEMVAVSSRLQLGLNQPLHAPPPPHLPSPSNDPVEKKDKVDKHVVGRWVWRGHTHSTDAKVQVPWNVQSENSQHTSLLWTPGMWG